MGLQRKEENLLRLLALLLFSGSFLGFFVVDIRFRLEQQEFLNRRGTKGTKV